MKMRKPEKIFIISSVLPNCSVNKEQLKSMENYARHLKKYNTEIIIYETALKEKETFWDKNIYNEYLIDGDKKLNSNLTVKNLNIRHTTMNPILNVGFYNNSIIIPAPRLAWNTLAKQNKSEKYPRAVFTTGTISNSENYKITKSEQQAKFIHEKQGQGFLIVEVMSNKLFVARQVDWDNENECFYDTLHNKQVLKVTSKSVKEDTAKELSTGDLHHDHLDYDCWEWTEELIKNTKPENLFLHDAFDASSWLINHHVANQMIKRENNAIDVKQELENFLQWLDRLSKKDFMKKTNIRIVASNHNEFIDRFVEDENRLRMVTDELFYSIKNSDKKKEVMAQNTLSVFSELINYVKSHKNPIEEYYLKRFSKNNRVIFNKRGDSYISKGGYQMLDHGDIGSNGSKGSPAQFNRIAPGATITGHTHSPLRTIFGNYVNGCSCDLNPSYTNPSGYSSWLQAHTIVFKNGKAQSLVFIQ
jgi:hypothetical protein